ncbi:MAG: RnfABCDGE type electron transport complex subunit D [Johnsonella sp.]|nr:RnfABCDGE type electron transport complex subunit D [Johnsonella sp.]
MENKYNVSSSPHVRDNSTTSKIMLDVVIAMLPASLFGVYQFGLSALVIILGTVFAAVLAEYAYERIMKKTITIKDYSAVVTGLILALNMPPEIPVWIPMLGSVFAIVVVKQFYGGIGYNWMNPALAARCFLLISFAGKMTDFSSKHFGFDALSGSTPMVPLKYGITDAVSSATQPQVVIYSLKDMFIGRIPGSIGEVSALALLIGAAYLLLKKVITLRIPLAYIISLLVFAFIFGEQDYQYIMRHLLGGGLIFGAFFMATDYTTSPITPLGQIIFGIFIGLLTGLFRIFGGSAEGVSYAIIIGNIVYPLIEKMTLPRAFGRRRSK